MEKKVTMTTGLGAESLKTQEAEGAVGTVTASFCGHAASLYQQGSWSGASPTLTMSTRS